MTDNTRVRVRAVWDHGSLAKNRRTPEQVRAEALAKRGKARLRAMPKKPAGKP